MFYTVSEKYVYLSRLLYYRFTRRQARDSAFLCWSLFSKAVYPQKKPK